MGRCRSTDARHWLSAGSILLVHSATGPSPDVGARESQGQGGTREDGASYRSVGGVGGLVEHREAPLVQGDQFRQQGGAQAVAVAAGPVDLQVAHRIPSGSGSTPSTGRPQPPPDRCAFTSSPNVVRAEPTNWASPSGQVRRPSASTTPADAGAAPPGNRLSETPDGSASQRPW